MNYKILSFVFACCFILTMSGIGYLYKKVTSSEDSIYELYDEINRLDSRIQELEDSKISSQFDSQMESLHQQEVSLLQKQIDFDKNRSMQQDVFYGLIKNSQYEDYITEIKSTNLKNENLSKVSVFILGTENIINFLSYVNGKAHYAYWESQRDF